MQAACGIQKHQVVAVLFCMGYGGLGDLHRAALPHLENRDIQLGAHGFKLFDRRGTVNVACGQKGALSLLFHICRQLRTVGGFTRALKAHEHADAGGFRGDIQLPVLAAHKGAQLLVDNLNHHLGRRQALQNIRPAGADGNGFYKIFDDLVAHVGLQQSQAHLAHCLFHVRLREAALAAQLPEGGIKFFGKALKRHL